MISDCEPELVNSQALRGPKTEYCDSVVRLLLAMSAEQSTMPADRISVEAKPLEIRILGEYVGNPEDEDEARPSGVLKALYDWLRQKLPHAIVSGVALDHKDIARFASGEEFDIWLEDHGSVSREPGLLRGVSKKPTDKRSYNQKKDQCLKQFDIVALPSYTIDDANGKGLLTSMSIEDLESLDVTTTDHLGAIGGEYLQRTIRAWSEMTCGADKTKIFGVPAFSHHPLIVSRRTSFKNEAFKSTFKDRSDRDFASFLSFADIRNTAIVGSQPDLLSCRLIMATESVARVYEWLLVLGNLGCKPFPSDGIDEQDLPSCLTKDEVFKASLRYALLNSLAPPQNGPTRSWNENMTSIMEKEAGFMFVWPDAVFGDYQDKETKRFSYAAVPAQYQLSETWMLTIPKAVESADKQRLLWATLIDLMTPESQTVFTDLGGIPVHSLVADNPTIWRKNPFARMLGLIRRAGHQQETISVPRRAFNGAKVGILGDLLGQFTDDFRKLVSNKEDGAVDALDALRLAQDSRHTSRPALLKSWNTKMQELNQTQARS